MVLPLNLYQEKKGKKSKVDNDVASIIKKPNPFMNEDHFKSLIGVDLCLHGNSYWQITKNGLGNVTGIYPLDALSMDVKLLETGQIVYVYQTGTKGQVVLNSDEVLHFKIFSMNGITGLSPVSYNAMTISLGMSQTEFSDKQYLNGMNSNVVLSHPNIMSDEAYQRLRDSFTKQYTGIASSGKPILLEDGMKIEKLSMNNTDAQYLENRVLTKDEIASIFRISPHFINELSRATYSNIEHLSLDFVKYTLTPYLITIEKELEAKLSKKQQYFKFQTAGILRGDIMSRYQSYQIAINSGFMSRNEVRALEDMDIVEGLDEFMIPLNMAQNTKDGDEASVEITTESEAN